MKWPLVAASAILAASACVAGEMDGCWNGWVCRPQVEGANCDPGWWVGPTCPAYTSARVEWLPSGTNYIQAPSCIRDERGLLCIMNTGWCCTEPGGAGFEDLVVVRFDSAIRAERMNINQRPDAWEVGGASAVRYNGRWILSGVTTDASSWLGGAGYPNNNRVRGFLGMCQGLEPLSECAITFRAIPPEEPGCVDVNSCHGLGGLMETSIVMDPLGRAAWVYGQDDVALDRQRDLLDMRFFRYLTDERLQLLTREEVSFSLQNGERAPVWISDVAIGIDGKTWYALVQADWQTALLATSNDGTHFVVQDGFWASPLGSWLQLPGFIRDPSGRIDPSGIGIVVVESDGPDPLGGFPNVTWRLRFFVPPGDTLPSSILGTQRRHLSGVIPR